MSSRSEVPVWTLATKRGATPADTFAGQAMTPERLDKLRAVLAAFADAPIVTLEAHPIERPVLPRDGIVLGAASPLAQQLAQLLSQTARTAPAVKNVQAASDVLYRMVVPAKVASEFGRGLVRPMTSKAASQGIHSALMSSSGIAAQATFVPVAADAAAIGAAGGAAGAAGATVAGATAITVAAPLVLMALAVGASAYADHQRHQAIEHLTELLEKLHADKLDAERNELEGCRDAIDKATAVLLDQGRLGVSLGLDSAVHAISKALEAATRRTTRWRAALDALPEGPVEVSQLSEAFPGLDLPSGEFRAHLELASLATALKRRVIVLQAVEHSQVDVDNPYENFVRSLRADQRRVDDLESQIAEVLRRLSTLELRSPTRLMDKLMTRGEVNDLLATAYRLRALGEERAAPADSDIFIDIARQADGTVVVFPARQGAEELAG